MRRLAAKAAAQQATRDLEAAVAEAHEVATRLRCTVWGEYGRESPVLHVFGMRPYPHTRKRAAAAPIIEGEPLPNVTHQPAPAPPDPEAKGALPLGPRGGGSKGSRSPTISGRANSVRRARQRWGEAPQ